MNDNDGNKDHPVTENGVPYEVAGYRVKDGDWQDVEAGANLPTEAQLGRIDLITINLDPDSDDGFYRSFNIFDGFDDLYGIDDLVDEAADAYGFAVQ